MDQREEGRGARAYVWGALAIATIVFVLMNSQEVEVRLFFATTQLPLIFALVLAVGLGFILGLLVPWLRGRRH